MIQPWKLWYSRTSWCSCGCTTWKSSSL